MGLFELFVAAFIGSLLGTTVTTIAIRRLLARRERKIHERRN